VKEYAAAVVGVPERTPVDELRARPAGRLPTVTPHVIGVEPVLLMVWLKNMPTCMVPKIVVVIVGAVPLEAMVPEYACVSLPAVFVA
jgi:hypothetical protein